MSPVTKWIAVFLSVALADVAWTRYNMAVTRGAPLPAATWSVVILLLGAISFFGYVEDRWMVVPAALGAFVGTYVAMKVKTPSST
mgnify:CR=1 FL=1|jgi:hypothetical protein